MVCKHTKLNIGFESLVVITILYYKCNDMKASKLAAGCSCLFQVVYYLKLKKSHMYAPLPIEYDSAQC